MTAQKPDIVKYKWTQYDLVGVNGSGLFTLAQIGITPMYIPSGCWRGYVCTYAVKRKQLFLMELEMGVDEKTVKEQHLTVFGKIPTTSYEFTGGGYDDPATGEFVEATWQWVECTRLNAFIPFSGGILLGKTFLETLRDNKGFQAAWKYKTVWELIFEHGRLLKAQNRSTDIQRIREGSQTMWPSPGEDASLDEINNWIDATRSQRYSFGTR